VSIVIRDAGTGFNPEEVAARKDVGEEGAVEFLS
jgi:hypothetical protein